MLALALCAAFVISDELLMVYDLEASHLRLLVAQLVSLLFLEIATPQRISKFT